MVMRETMMNDRAMTKPWTMVLFGTIAALAFLLLFTGCGSNSNTLTASNTQLKIGDAPADSVISFEMTITSVSLTTQGGSTVTAFSGSREIELAHLAATVEPLALANVPAGTYTKASIGYSGAEITYIPTTGTTPVHKSIAASGTATITPASPVTIGPNANILSIDMNLANSITFDASGNPTAVNPQFSISSTMVASEAGEDEESGEVEDAVGTVSAAPANNQFTLNLQTTGQSATFNVDANTEFSDGLTAFTDIKQGMLLRVDASTGTNGSFNAKKVELVEASGSDVEGLVTSITGAPVTSFGVIAVDGAGSGMSATVIGTPVTVTVTNSTQFRANTDHINLSGLSTLVFSGSANLAPGQHVEIESAAPVSTGAATADKVTLVKQALSGTASAIAITGGTGTFTLTVAPDSAFAKVSGASTVTVHVQSTTELKGITAVPAGAVKVRGMLFFDGTNYQFVASRIALP